MFERVFYIIVQYQQSVNLLHHDDAYAKMGIIMSGQMTIQQLEQKANDIRKDIIRMLEACRKRTLGWAAWPRRNRDDAIFRYHEYRTRGARVD